MNTNLPPTEKPELFSFSFQITGFLKEFVKLTLFDGSGSLLTKSYEKLELSLPRGLYQLHIQSNENVVQKLIRLNGNYEEKVKSESSYSSITGEFLTSSHEYYSKTADHWSKHATIKNKEQLSSSLFIFFRYPDKETKSKQKNATKSLGRSFILLNKERKLLYGLHKTNIKEDLETGWMAFHAPLEPGIYYLVYLGRNKREIPLFVFTDWQTQLFITFKKTPIFQTTRLLIFKPNHQVPNKSERVEMDALLQKMQNGIFYVPPSILKRFANGQLENPVFAMAICYAYFLCGKNKYDNLIKLIIENLQSLIYKNFESSDLKAILLLAALHFKKEIPYLEVNFPCMFLPGMKIIIEQASIHSDKIVLKDIAENIVPWLKNDSIWTSYKPLKHLLSDSLDVPLYSVLTDSPAYEGDLSFSSYEGADSYDEADGNDGSGRDYGSKSYYTKTFSSFESELIDWIGQSIANQLSIKSEIKPSIEELALQFQITPIMVTERVQQLNDLSFRELSRVVPSYFTITNQRVNSENLKDNIQFLLDNH